jgi:hypothetical protein
MIKEIKKEEDRDLIEDIGLAAKATGKGTVFGLAWLAKQVTKGAVITGKTFKEQWKKAK